jgi:tRNA-specific 2-thiouridylase
MNVAGEKVGEHQGAYYYTIGQRRGLGVGGSPVPLYISDKDVKKNTITVAPEGDESLLRKTVTLGDMSFTGAKPSGRLLVRIRYRQPLFRAKMIGRKVVFDKPEKFVAPGQSAVLYDNKGKMLGGGIITSAA